MFEKRRFLKFVSKLSVSQRHVVVLGPTGSGKTTFTEAMLRYLPCDYLVFDYYGEYAGRLPRTVRVKPSVPFGRWVKNLSMMLRPVSGGVELTCAVYDALRGAGTWDDFIKGLERNVSMRRFWRGSEGVLSRLIPLRYAGVLSDDGFHALPRRCLVDLSSLEEEEKLYTVLLMLTWIYTNTSRKRSTRLFIVVEEFKAYMVGQVTPAVAPLLDRFRKYNVRLVLLTQTLPSDDDLRSTLLQQNLVIFYPGEPLARELWMRGVAPRDILDLKEYQALAYLPERKQWTKIRVNPQRRLRAPGSGCKGDLQAG